MLAADVSVESLGEFLAPLRDGEAKSLMSYLWAEDGLGRAKPIVVMAFKHVYPADELVKLLEAMVNNVLEDTYATCEWSARIELLQAGIPASNRGSTECSKSSEDRDE